MRRGIMALEAIHFQNEEFFDKLTQAVSALRGFGAGLKEAAYWASPEVLTLTNVIKKHTRISFSIQEGESTGPTTIFPQLDANSIVWSQLQRQQAASELMVDQFSDVRQVLKGMKVKQISGSVDLKRGVVSGAYEAMEMLMLLPRSMLFKDAPYQADEVAAIMLHEVGHAFTCMEFVSRSVSTNQVLAGLTRALDDTVPETIRTAVFAQGAELLRMTPEQQAALLKAKDKNEITCVVVDAATRVSISELGGSVYDSVTSEYLADQYVARHGGGRQLVTALDKYNTSTWRSPKTAGYWMANCIGIVSLFTFGVLTLGMPWFLILFTQDKQNNLYDNEKSRFLRIKHQNVERLKARELSAKEKKTLIEANEAIDAVCEFYDDHLSFIEKAAYYLRPSYRAAHKYEVLQKQLEALASNSLFTHAAKLSLI